VSTGILGAAAVAGALAASSGGAPVRHVSTVSLAQISRAANQDQVAKVHRSASSDGDVGGITTASLPGLVQRSTGVSLDDTYVSGLSATNDLDLSAALDVDGQPYLNVQVMPADTADFASATCGDLNDLSSPDSDGYTGPCTAQTLSDGSVLVVRSGQTPTGGFTMAQASIVRPDGSAITAEDTNEAAMLTPSARQQFIKKIVKSKEDGTSYPRASIVSTQPSLDASVLTALVKDLAAAER
jgi:hypothetical protein